MNHDNCLPRSELQIPFAAEPREVPALRRIIRQHLAHWGLLGVADAAQLCVSELATNVIKHVGFGVSATLVISMEGTNLRLEVRDPSMEQLPRSVRAEGEDEDGRGLALIDAMSQKWGVCLRADGKATWCELATMLTSSHGHIPDHRVSRADELLTTYGQQARFTVDLGGSPVTRAAEDAVRLIADLLHWVEAHGLDPETTLERARSCFENLSAR
ncbi:ATP-binding protein [Streptomyces olivaceoviridis]|uniref:ATP-binding protein n=1 Tax=Streptomyces olivaceoviridis TaxID=1921 RepID=UPI000686896A